MEKAQDIVLFASDVPARVSGEPLTPKRTLAQLRELEFSEEIIEKFTKTNPEKIFGGAN